jgi:hypothetical protein
VQFLNLTIVRRSKDVDYKECGRGNLKGWNGTPTPDSKDYFTQAKAPIMYTITYTYAYDKEI